MNTPVGALMKEARASLKGRWRLAIKASFIVIAITAIPGFIKIGEDLSVGDVLSLFIIGPFSFGTALFFLNFLREEHPKLHYLFEGFNFWWRTTKAYLLMTLYIFLWALLLIIPGIIRAFAYSQTFYVLADDKEIGARAALRKSMVMMKGYKWKLFRVHLRILGLAILCIFTLGIGFIWLLPYAQVVLAKFYEDIKGVGLAENPSAITPEEKDTEFQPIA
jgi:uncharacterized membrane protein